MWIVQLEIICLLYSWPVECYVYSSERGYPSFMHMYGLFCPYSWKTELSRLITEMGASSSSWDLLLYLYLMSRQTGSVLRVSLITLLLLLIDIQTNLILSPHCACFIGVQTNFISCRLIALALLVSRQTWYLVTSLRLLYWYSDKLDILSPHCVCFIGV